MNFIVGEIVELKENIRRYPLQSTEIANQIYENHIIERPCIILILKLKYNLYAHVLVNGQVGWLPISILQKVH
jgi:hypothetical protein